MKFKVNHLVTFTSTSQQRQQTYYEAIKRLQEVEEVIGVWRQKVYIELTDTTLNILEAQSSEVIEQFPTISVRKPEAIDYNSIYLNLLIFTVYLSKESAEMHIFDCRTESAQKIVQQIINWRKESLKFMPRTVSTYPVVNQKQKELKSYSLIDKNKNDSQLLECSEERFQFETKVKAKVNAFNRIAIQRKLTEEIEKMSEKEEASHTELSDNWKIKPKKLQPFRYF